MKRLPFVATLRSDSIASWDALDRLVADGRVVAGCLLRRSLSFVAAEADANDLREAYRDLRIEADVRVRVFAG